ncbi:hypothetical protein A2U01_0054618, partial [Trifolium medium]|nr:hypothetical protein [Trifolium medium]
GWLLLLPITRSWRWWVVIACVDHVIMEMMKSCTLALTVNMLGLCEMFLGSLPSPQPLKHEAQRGEVLIMGQAR